jgi:hypothetical protein
MPEVLKDLSLLWMHARRTFQGSVVLVDACQKKLSRITRSCSAHGCLHRNAHNCMPGEPFKDLSLVLVECLLEALKDIVLAVIMVTCRDSQNAFVCKFDHPMYTARMTLLAASGKDP